MLKESPIPVEINYKVSPTEVMTYFYWTAFNLPGARRRIRVERFIIVLLGAPQAFRWATEGGTGILVGGVVLSSVLVAAWGVPRFFAWLRARKAFSAIQLDALDAGVSSIKLTEDGLLHSYPGVEQHFSWAELDRVEQNAETTYLFTSETHALVIPSTAFGSEGERQAFICRLKDSIEGAHRLG